MHDVVLAITGASGSIYALRLLDVLRSCGRNVHLTISPAATQVLEHETGIQIDLERFRIQSLLSASCLDTGCMTGRQADHIPEEQTAAETRSAPPTTLGQIVYHHYRDYTAGIASGSFPTAGMVICPCSMGSLAGIANGVSTNLIQRAADVHLKERRTLIVVPRETPLGSIQLANMKTLADAGAIVLPAMPGFYHHPKTIHDLVDFIVGRICDHLGVVHRLFARWGSNQP